jgi:flagellar biosynthesis/type III secretory pathway protein FliH
MKKVPKRKKKTFPSEVKYREKNPMVSFRLKREDYKRLKEIVERSGKSIAQFVREIALEVNREESASYTRGYEDGYKKGDNEGYEKGYDEAYGMGFEDGMEKYKIWYYYSICGKRIEMLPNRDDHKAMIEYMRENG